MVTRLPAAGIVLAAALAPAAARDLLLEAEIDPPRVHVQTQAVLRLRFYQGVDLRNIELAVPAPPLAELRPIGGTRVSEALREGRRYRVHERSYAVFPFASGRLEIAGAEASGQRPGAAGPLRLPGPVLALEVLPLPAGAPALVATRLTLSESWSPTVGEAVPGTALQRRIRVEAAGIDAGQIPELNFAIPGMTVHAGAARLDNRFDGETHVAVREQAFELVPQRPGELAVPELRLDWWDSVAGAKAVAVLPARHLRITGRAPGVAPPAVAAVEPLRSPVLPAALAALLAGAGVALLVWMRRPGRRAARRLRRACRSGDAAAIRAALLGWAALLWPESPPASLGALAERLRDPEARACLWRLERGLYGPEPGAPARPEAGMEALEVELKHLHRRCPKKKPVGKPAFS